MSEAEWILWSNLKNRGMGVKFRRQVPIGRYIVDFLSMEIKLVIEVDGGQHGNRKQIEHDEIRDIYLKNEVYTVLRVWSLELIESLDECCLLISEKINALI